MITVRIDRSTIRRNPNAGETSFLVPGRTSTEIKDGCVVQRRQVRRIFQISPAPPYLYDYVPTISKCEGCGKSIDVLDLDIDDDGGFDICPECRYPWHEEITKEELTDDMISQALSEKIPVGEDKLLAGLASSELRVVAGKVLHVDEVMHKIREGVEEMDGFNSKLKCTVAMIEEANLDVETPEVKNFVAVKVEVLFFSGVMENIRVALEGMDGDDVAEAHNSICAKKICYDKDSAWGYTGEDDNVGS